MRRLFVTVLFLSLPFWVLSQEFRYWNSRDGVDIYYKIVGSANEMVLQFTNKNTEKVYVSTGDIIWLNGEKTVGKSGGGGLTLASGATSSFGMFFFYPKGTYDDGFSFRLQGLRIEIGGMGQDARYNKTSSRNGGSGSGPVSLQLQAEIKFFYVQHHNTEESLDDLKRVDPDNADNYENKYRALIDRLLDAVKVEDAKRGSGSLSVVKLYRKQLDDAYYQINSLIKSTRSRGNKGRNQN